MGSCRLLQKTHCLLWTYRLRSRCKPMMMPTMVQIALSSTISWGISGRTFHISIYLELQVGEQLLNTEQSKTDIISSLLLCCCYSLDVLAYFEKQDIYKEGLRLQAMPRAWRPLCNKGRGNAFGGSSGTTATSI